MLAWIHRNLPIVLAAALSLLLHMAVLFPAIRILAVGAHPETSERASLGRALPGMSGKTLESEAEKAKRLANRAERERLMQRKLNIRRMQREATLVRPKPEEVKPEPPDPTKEPPEPKVELGIDESNAVTMNWIGYAEYEKHLAALSEVEQAALRLETASGAGGEASPTLPPAPPGPTVAMSPNPSDVPLPASAGGPDAPTETTLIAPGSLNPTSPPAATARTEADSTAGNSAELARPLPPPEQERTTPAPDAAPASEPAEPETTDDKPVPAPVGTDGDAPAPPRTTDTAPVPSESTKPAPVPEDPSNPAPRADPIRNDPSEAEPSKIEPEKRLDPAPSGAADNLPPRENSDPAVDSPKPPIDAPPSERDPTNSPDAAPNESADGTARNAAPTPPTEIQGGGVRGPDVVNGQSNVPVAPSPAGLPGDARAGQGALSNRESDPTSIIDVPRDVWNSTGKPLARQGISLNTRKPSFTVQQLVEGVRFNPVVELVIGRDGVPQHVTIVRSSGNTGVNEAMRAALFKWRATGRQVERLRPGQTVTIRLKLIMLAD